MVTGESIRLHDLQLEIGSSADEGTDVQKASPEGQESKESPKKPTTASPVDWWHQDSARGITFSPGQNGVPEKPTVCRRNKLKKQTWSTVLTNRAFSEGKHTLEFSIDALVPGINKWHLIVGIVPAGAKRPVVWLGAVGGVGYVAGNGGKINASGDRSSFGEQFGQGDTIAVHLDFDEKSVSFSKNGGPRKIAFPDF
eukprot:GABV01000626.1.p1 GENE.GABV01000626.1~~GABV01000626.1.p1  ORF type:complete len:197 (-),score=39.12 GABV01000626.1:138-728(-)